MASSVWLCIYFDSFWLILPPFLDWCISAITFFFFHQYTDLEATGNTQVETLSRWGWNCLNAIENSCLPMSHLAGISSKWFPCICRVDGCHVHCMQASIETGIHESSLTMELDAECVNIKAKSYLIYRYLGQENSKVCIENDYRSLEWSLHV